MLVNERAIQGQIYCGIKPRDPQQHGVISFVTKATCQWINFGLYLNWPADKMVCSRTRRSLITCLAGHWSPYVFVPESRWMVQIGLTERSTRRFATVDPLSWRVGGLTD